MHVDSSQTLSRRISKSQKWKKIELKKKKENRQNATLRRRIASIKRPKRVPMLSFPLIMTLRPDSKYDGKKSNASSRSLVIDIAAKRVGEGRLV